MFGDLFICRFPFTSGAFSKPRLALVLFDLDDDVLICRVTSVLRSGKLDVTLKGWSEAGLLKPSVARLDRLLTAEKTVLRTYLGRLTLEDENRIRNYWNEYMRL